MFKDTCNDVIIKDSFAHFGVTVCTINATKAQNTLFPALFDQHLFLWTFLLLYPLTKCKMLYVGVDILWANVAIFCNVKNHGDIVREVD